MTTCGRIRLLTDEHWARLSPCLPRNAGKAGRPFADHRRIIEGIIYRYRTGIPWRDLPREAFGPWQTVWKRHRRWAADGTWDTVLAQLTAQADSIGGIDWTVSVDSTINRAHQHATNTARPEKDTGAVTRRSKSEAPATLCEPEGHAIGRSRGGLTTKIHHAVDGHGRPLAVVVTPGQVHDAQVFPLVLGDIRVPRLGRGRPRTTPDALLADKAYASQQIRADLASRGIRAVIPERADQQANRKRKGRSGGRPRTLDAETYKRRNVVERSFSLLKQWRGLATRYDKLAIVYRSAAVLAAVITWLRS
ncbi:IS5 family transposase [Streptomyces fuscichromogenes]|uniref:DDE transposase n=1 Tax=Streptomyces fuscichromogenes TaxID=1324013 RepID=A0A917XP02_9ACTN|nr:IS5 family transposase [Streptomyces fuscichromogenes]GGN45225.1 DDE transposase [Streptomyces fuscichromogenes]